MWTITMLIKNTQMQNWRAFLAISFPVRTCIFYTMAFECFIEPFFLLALLALFEILVLSVESQTCGVETLALVWDWNVVVAYLSSNTKTGGDVLTPDFWIFLCHLDSSAEDVWLYQLCGAHDISEGDSMRLGRPKDKEKFCNAGVNHHCADRSTQVQIWRAFLVLSFTKEPTRCCSSPLQL